MLCRSCSVRGERRNTSVLYMCVLEFGFQFQKMFRINVVSEEPERTRASKPTSSTSSALSTLTRSELQTETGSKVYHVTTLLSK